jgi:hypothetical protein
VRQLPALATLELKVDDNVPPCKEWPPFIPPTLKALRIHVDQMPSTQRLLRVLPGMLEAGGSRLERLEVKLPYIFENIGGGLVQVAQALHCCSPTLKAFHLSTEDDMLSVDPFNEKPVDFGEQVERMRVQWGQLLAGVSACRELQVLVLPAYAEVEPLLPARTAFRRLTHLKICYFRREHLPDAGVMTLWELMASGGLPALAKLSMSLEEWGDSGPVRTRVAPALEAVAGTLTQLDVGVWYKAGSGEEVDAAYELGVAVGKLRRLNDLALGLGSPEDGRAYHAFAQGLAASGAERPLPLLWRVRASSRVTNNSDLLASLLLPSVRVFVSPFYRYRQSVPCIDRATLLTACALRQVGYKHTWAVECWDEVLRDAVQAIAQCRRGNPRPEVS